VSRFCGGAAGGGDGCVGGGGVCGDGGGGCSTVLVRVTLNLHI